MLWFLPYALKGADRSSNEKADRIYYGGITTPTEWDDKTIEEDNAAFQKGGDQPPDPPCFFLGQAGA